MIRAGIITVSDRSSEDVREDLSGPAVAAVLATVSAEIVETIIVPDEKDRIKEAIKKFADIDKLDLFITTGGTDVSQRDVTSDTILEIIERQIPVMAEAMRYESLKITPLP